MTVFVVIESGDGDETQVIGVFSDEKKALIFSQNQRKKYGHRYDYMFERHEVQ